MSTHKFFSSRANAIVLGIASWVSLLVVGISYGQNTLNIPSNLENAVISIRDVFLSDDGTKQGNNATIQLLGDSGDIISKWSLSVLNDATLQGNAVVWSELTFKALWPICKELILNGPLEEEVPDICVLLIDEEGKVSVDGFLATVNEYSTGITEILGDIRDYSASKTDPDIYFATPSDGHNESDILVRIGIEKSSGIASTTDAQLVVKDEIQTRDAFTITKKPGNSSPIIAANKWLLNKFFVGDGVAESRISQSSDGKGMVFTQIPDDAGSVWEGWHFIFRGKNLSSHNIKVGINTNVATETLDVDGNILWRNTIIAREDIIAKGNIATTGSVDAGMKRPNNLGGGFYNYYSPLNRDGSLNITLQWAAASNTSNGYRNGWKIYDIPDNILTCLNSSCTTDFSPILAVNGAWWFYGSIQAEFDANVGGYLRVKKDADIDGQVKATTYLYNSDARYKSAITPLDNALDKVLALNGYSYFNKLSDQNDIGVIAQEIEKVFPELVHTDSEGYKSVQYANLIAPLIEAVKELNGKLDAQTKQLNDLEARLQALEAK